MQAEEIRELTTEEIADRVRMLTEERFRLRVRRATEVLEDPLRFRVIRRDLARLKTVLRERALAAAPPRRGRRREGRHA